MMREIALRKVFSELGQYKAMALAGSDESDPWDASNAINDALSFLAALPGTVPVPKSALLLKQVAVYWDFHGVYAEIDFDGSGHVDAYGKRSGVDEVLIDRLRVTDAVGQSSFPVQLERILIPQGQRAALVRNA